MQSFKQISMKQYCWIDYEGLFWDGCIICFSSLRFEVLVCDNLNLWVCTRIHSTKSCHSLLHSHFALDLRWIPSCIWRRSPFVQPSWKLRVFGRRGCLRFRDDLIRDYSYSTIAVKREVTCVVNVANGACANGTSSDLHVVHCVPGFPVRSVALHFRWSFLACNNANMTCVCFWSSSFCVNVHLPLQVHSTDIFYCISQYGYVFACLWNGIY